MGSSGFRGESKVEVRYVPAPPAQVPQPKGRWAVERRGARVTVVWRSNG